ncbi:MAG: energy transducer TonB, partial [Bacteroidales bacterium]|nr:energy transducer TonB [Bacteroidales bacterium]
MSKTSRGKKICGYLKGIRRKIAEENDIKLDIPECTYEGECRGTCPRCEWEVQYLEKTLFERMKLGK